MPPKTGSLEWWLPRRSSKLGPAPSRSTVRSTLVVLGISLAAGQPAPPAGTPAPAQVLAQARARLQAMSRNLERYVCIETVNRSYYQQTALPEPAPQPEAEAACGSAASATPVAEGKRRLESTDRVRLEVTLADGRELHSWPGATRFESRDVDALIRNGPVSTGAFGSYLASIFGPPEVAFRYNGERVMDGRTLFEYRYSVPLEASHYDVRVNVAWRPAAFEGEFSIDPRTLTLERLTIRTSGLPAGATFCQASTAVDYQHVHIGDSDVLLPGQSMLEIVLGHGRETRNITTFANCREYQAESEISFDESSHNEATAARAASRGLVSLPIGLPISLALTAPIDTSVAAAGDPVAATVVKPVRRPGSPVDLIPAGAVVQGRLRRVEHHLLSTPYFLIVISFNRVDIRGALSPFAARSEPDPDLARELGANLAVRETGVRFWGIGSFLFPTNKPRLVIPAGFQSKWFTLAIGGR